MNDGEWFRAGINIAISVISCLTAARAGYLLAASINAMKWT
jgi:hypothetical protein